MLQLCSNVVKEQQYKHVRKIHGISFIVLRISVEIQTHQDTFLGQRLKFLYWSCLLFCDLHFTQDLGVTLILKIQLPTPLKQLDQDFDHNIAEKSE